MSAKKNAEQIMKNIPLEVFDKDFISLIILQLQGFVIENEYGLLRRFRLTFSTLVLDFIYVHFRADSDSAGICPADC